MKIFILPSWYPYPSNPINGTFFKDHAESLSQAGHEVIVVAAEIVSLRSYFSSRKDLGTRIYRENGVKTYQCLAINRHPKHPEAFYKRYRKILKTLLDTALGKEGKPDCFHVHSSLWAGAALASYDLDIPFIISEHLKEFLLYNGFSTFQKRLINASYRKASALIAPSTPVMKRIKQYFTIPPQCRTHVVGNMVDTEFFKPPENDLPKNHFTYLVVALLRPEKQIDKIIRAFMSIGNTNLAKIRVVGDGPEYEYLHKTARECSLSRQVEFIRKTGREVVLNNLQNADVCVLYSVMETFGVALVEALSCGVPVIAGNIGGANDYVNEDNGILVPVDDPMALHDAMNSMINNPEKYDSQKIRRDIAKRYDKNVIIAKLEAIYTDTCRTRK
ncbi:MAG: glycosyltransferase family 4 protein [Candidatus Marinimicrobia bacterium]|nr:glycosyltransferase family 4 protein [Candidatus Neomarinimicrobiota bacterium]